MNITPVPKKNAGHGNDTRLPAEPARRGLTAIFALTIFAGAFLLFQVQPLMAKFVLPWFGGSSAVWTTCMLFFQIFLVAGYAYAHATTRFLPVRGQAVLHAALLLTALAALPIVPGAQWKPAPGDTPVWRILELLTVCLGLPYFVLSSTGPLLQAWFARLRPAAQPYRLYALSNAASLLALLSYPFVVEPSFTRRTQAGAWAWSFGIFAVSCGGCAWLLWKNNPKNEAAPDKRAEAAVPDRTATDKALWFLLPLCGSVLLLATTNKLCLDVASFPFLWVLPLSVYLLTFILCFDRPAWYARKFFMLLLVPALALMCYALLRGSAMNLIPQAAISCGTLFIGCMVCHGEVYRLKPPKRSLTAFYLSIAAGGAVGGAFVAVVAPLVFRSYAEMNWGLWLLALLVVLVCGRERLGWTIAGHRTPLWPVALVAALALGTVLLLQSKYTTRYAVAMSRNFYAASRVNEFNRDIPELHAYQFVNGTIDHGLQFLDPVRAARPVTYYHELSGVGLALKGLSARPNLRVGIVGLGTGTLAAYGRSGDTFRFYEINPDVVTMAGTWFSYLRQSKARVEIVPGDARLSLEREPPQNFDLLVLDAFSSDAVPVHLLTKEAFDTYARHLKPGGVIAVNVSNVNLDLIPVVTGDMEHLNMDMVYIHWTKDPMPFGFHSSGWLLMTHDRVFLESPAIFSHTQRPDSPLASETITWTDDHASVFRILKRRWGSP
ncbi:MAG TPA: fused MFS/spermidine synthase [Opitutaceae bacterium]|jgi:hypothetical protein|nr:fused MFS/spermidine synthase [Opitutaceae bacterium]